MTYHIVMPFSRPENVDALIKNIEPMGVILHPIISKGMDNPFPKAAWIQPLTVDVPEHWDPCYYKLNQFIRKHKATEDDFYLLQFCDDDALPADFFKKLSDTEPAQIATIVSSKQGHKTPLHRAEHLRHPARNFTACRENMAIGRAGSCRPVVRGKYLYAVCYPNCMMSDQMTLVALVNAFKDGITYRSDVWVEFNRLEAGRWEDIAPAEERVPTKGFCGSYRIAVWKEGPRPEADLLIVPDGKDWKAGEVHIITDKARFKSCCESPKVYWPAIATVNDRVDVPYSGGSLPPTQALFRALASDNIALAVAMSHDELRKP